MWRDLPPLARLPLLVLGMASLLGGVLAGLARLAWEVPPATAQAAGAHGALMISAFFGTVISLERAVALKRGWAYLAPLLAGFSGVALLTGAAPLIAPGLAVAAAAVMVAASAAVLARQVAPFTLTLALGALCWLVGNLLWLAGLPPGSATPWWLAFLVLTIAGERLELTRLLPTPPLARKIFGLIALLLPAGAGLSTAGLAAGPPLFAAALLLLAGWLLRYDIARQNARQQGLTRFIALCLLGGYGWLAVAGLLGLDGALLPGHPWRDAALHAVGLGFVFAMVFGHAPIIFPAITGVRVPYHPLLYVPLIALHLSLAARFIAGLAEHPALRSGAGFANAATLLLFVVLLLSRVHAGHRPSPPSPPKVPR